MVRGERAAVGELHHLAGELFGEVVSLISGLGVVPKIVYLMGIGAEIVKLAPVGAFVQS